MRHIPDFVIYLSGLGSTISFVFCGIFFPSNKAVGIWALYGGLIFGLLTGFLYWQNDIWKAESQTNKSPEAYAKKSEKKSNKEQRSLHEASSQKTKNENNKMKDEPKPTIITPNSVISIDQKGGITAHTVNINKFPEPKFDMKLISANVPQNDLFETKALLTIESKTALKNLYLEAKAPSITNLEVIPQRTGMSMSGHSGKRNGFAFTNILDAWGQYMLIILSQKPEKYEIIYNYE